MNSAKQRSTSAKTKIAKFRENLEKREEEEEVDDEEEDEEKVGTLTRWARLHDQRIKNIRANSFKAERIAYKPALQSLTIPDEVSVTSNLHGNANNVLPSTMSLTEVVSPSTSHAYSASSSGRAFLMRSKQILSRREISYLPGVY